MRNTIYSALMGLLMIGLSTFKAYGQADTNAKIKSLFIYNFSKYIEWPVEMRDGDFVIGVLGDYPTLYSELSKMAQSKTRGNQNFKIVNYSNINDVGKCHILFVDSKLSSQLTEVINLTTGRLICQKVD